jgi:hypothetical protein
MPRKFEKGNPGGPGRPRRDPELAKASKITRTEAELLLSKFMQMDIEELEAILRDKKKKCVEHMIGRIVLMGIKNGDHARLDFMLNRLIGKVKDTIEVSVKPKIIHNLDGGGATLSIEEKDE